MSKPLDEKDDGGPAFPKPCDECSHKGNGLCEAAHDGISARAYASIHLRVPDSGIGWLDEMILKAKRDEFAGKAMEGAVLGPRENDAKIGRWAYYFSDALMKERAK